MDRYLRQRLLAAIGERGQQRIAQATFVVASATPVAAQVEREYLLRAGAEHFTALTDSPARFAHAALFQNAAARDFAEGAWRALAQLRSTLEHSP